MSKGSHIFAQAVAKINWTRFSEIVEAHAGDKGVKRHGCRELLTTMMFAQFAGADSLREIVQGMESHGGGLQHLGIGKPFKKSSLADSLANRPWEVFRDMFDHLAETLGPRISAGAKPNGIKAKFFSVDSTTIDLCLSVFDWAKFHHSKGAVKVHTVIDHDSLIPVFATVSEGRRHDVREFKEGVLPAFDFPEGSVIAMDRGYSDYGLFRSLTDRKVFFVTRRKRNAVLDAVKTVQDKPSPARDGGTVTRDEVVEVSSGQQKGMRLRLVHLTAEDGKQLVLMTNNFAWAASTIAGIYKDRWQVELFFKQIKQNLKIKSFVATTENAVKIQIYSALCAIILMRYLKQVSDERRKLSKCGTFSFSNMATMLRLNLFQYHDLVEWLQNPLMPPLAPRKEGDIQLGFPDSTFGRVG